MFCVKKENIEVKLFKLSINILKVLFKIQKFFKLDHYYITDTCKIKYFICDPVSVTKKLRPLQAKIKYQSAHNNVSSL